MAGVYFHLWLAVEAWGRGLSRLPRACQSGLLPCFLAGAIAPDLGFFPGGPVDFSTWVHEEPTGDLVRALAAEARSPAERALATGWGLHVVTDQIVHGWVDDQVDRLFAGPQAPPDGDRDLWHMRLEWGIDCQLLARPESRPLWWPRLAFPARPDGDLMLAAAGSRYSGGELTAATMDSAGRTAQRWLRWLPWLLYHCGKVRPVGWRRPCPWAASLDRLTEVHLGDRWAGRPGRRTAAAVARPWAPAPLTQALIAVHAERCLDAFGAHASHGFSAYSGAAGGEAGPVAATAP